MEFKCISPWAFCQRCVPQIHSYLIRRAEDQTKSMAFNVWLFSTEPRVMKIKSWRIITLFGEMMKETGNREREIIVSVVLLDVDVWVACDPTCCGEQQRTVVSVQILHGGDAGVPRVSVVEVVQPLALLPVPETAANTAIRRQSTRCRTSAGRTERLTRCCLCRLRRCRCWRGGTSRQMELRGYGLWIFDRPDGKYLEM